AGACDEGRREGTWTVDDVESGRWACWEDEGLGLMAWTDDVLLVGSFADMPDPDWPVLADWWLEAGPEWATVPDLIGRPLADARVLAAVDRLVATVDRLVATVDRPLHVPAGPGTVLLALVMMLWVFAFTPHPEVLATVPGLVALLALTERCPRYRDVVLWLVLFGAVATGIGYSWLAGTIQRFGGVEPVVSWFLLALFGVWNTIHGWIFVGVHRSWLARGRRPHPLLTVALFVGCEALPIRMFGWMSGHGAVDVPPLLQAAAWGGVAGVSFVLCCLVVPVHEWLRWAFARRGPPARLAAALVTFLVGMLLYGVGLVAYGTVQKEERDATRHLRTALVQSNVGSLDKRRATEGGPTARRASIAAYRRLTAQAVAEKAKLVLWGETAITERVPLLRDRETNLFLRTRGYDFLLEAGKERAFLVGLYEAAPGPTSLLTGKRKDRRYNDAALRSPGGLDAPWSAYRKVHLIPFGETMPLGLPQSYLPQGFEMLAGTPPQPFLEVYGITMEPSLCYEGILADYVRENAGGKRPDLLVNLTNDSWFGDTWEPHQHLNFSRFRAVEHRAPLLRVTNTGISAFVSATGDVEASLGVGVAGVLVREVPIVDRGPTLYVRLGHAFPWLLLLLALGGWLLALLRPPDLRSPRVSAR
ncbi:MAG: apolipoprotein N-acyltransferase, partial [Planctomycetota bacterium]